MHFLYTYIFCLFILGSCKPEKTFETTPPFTIQDSTALPKVITAAERVALYHPLLEGKKVGLVVNHTSMIKDKHLVDSLLKLGVNIQVVFAPEHGFRGEADAGETIKDTKDKSTGLPIISLYGNKKKPSPEDLKGVDIVVFDIQDVGVRFYTYISTLHYVMETCAENNIPLIVLDRPNPNRHYVDGPVLQSGFESFIGVHKVPVVYGMTIGEYAQMINGEKWLANNVQCDLTVIANNQYSSESFYELPIKPSPNLPNTRSILLYPSICFFEGTTLSLGRGTELQFQQVGHPKINSKYSFTPRPNLGAKNPPLNGQLCFGTDLSKMTIGSLLDAKKIDLTLLIQYYKELNSIGEKFFLDNLFMDKLAGTDQLRKMIIAGKTEAEIRKTWQKDLDSFKIIREKYLLYK